MVQVGGTERVVAAGVEAHHFHDLACREVYETCVGHVRTWRAPPSTEAVRRRHPGFQLQQVHDELDYLIVEFRHECAYKSGLQKWQDIGLMLDRADPNNDAFDPKAKGQVAELFMEHAREMATLIPIARSSRLSDMAQRILAMKEQQREGVLPGVKLGIPQLDPYVYAIRPTEFVVHAAYSNVGKTTGMVRSSIQAYEEGDTPMFVSLEMEEDEIWEMFDAQAAQLSRRAINRRELGDEDWASYERAAERVAGASNDIIVFDELPGGATIDKLASYVDRYNPQTVCVDYISLMQPLVKNIPKWEAVAEISSGLKRLARAYKIRVYAAAQNTRDAAVNGPTEDNIAHSLTVYQDCNLMVGYHQDLEMLKKRQMQIRLVKSRGSEKPLTHALEYWDKDRLIYEDWTRQHEWRMKIDSEAPA